MFRKLTILAVLGASTFNIDGVGAQEPAPTRVESSPVFFHPLLLDTAAFEQPSWKSRIVTGLAGAALGAGIGFFASQVAQGDWDEEGRRQPVNRSTWAAVGGASGLLLGFSVPIGGQARPGAGGSFPGSDRFIITDEQIREASVSNALEAVTFFHPEWLRQQRPDSAEDFRIFTAGEIPVYLGNARLEGIHDMAGISAIVVRSIRFLNTQQATVRWGTGHRFGAIQILTQD
jgi:hypothetical protein